MKFHFSLLLLLVGLSDAWVTPLTNSNSPLQRIRGTTRAVTTRVSFSSPYQSTTDEYAETTSTEIYKAIEANKMMGAMTTALIGIAVMSASPEAASAAMTTTADIVSSSIITAGGSVKSALFAYGHYFSILGIVAILMTERWTLENGPNLSDEEENRLAIADTLYGVFGLLLVYTGYYRLSDTALGKGTDFYIHEPIFWLKIALVGVLGAASFFNTTKIIQRSIARNTGDKIAEPMSEELCNRMKSICNAQLTGLVFIPVAATFMARGIGYNESIPWPAEAGVSALIFLGLGFKYIKEALTFEQRLAEKSSASTSE
uniref:H(+)-exporting diphosphatase n=1 Tax=Pseudo-nitzschia australis TaxID=44445 RepID=A0A7S4ARG6_9STRA|mmetsp:Transcript_1580/g.3506  ORF Transcript_1580/g.3506 Transcript_1580/m.3506 type:complete len:316 (-) Transcript_1580:364-1311(-)